MVMLHNVEDHSCSLTYDSYILNICILNLIRHKKCSLSRNTFTLQLYCDKELTKTQSINSTFKKISSQKALPYPKLHTFFKSFMWSGQ